MIILLIVLGIVAIAAVAGIIAFIAELFRRSAHKPYGPYERFIKRPLDAFLATGAIIVLSPILLVTAILVRIKLGSPVLFTQERPGYRERIFRLIKFRTMTNEKDPEGNLLPDAQRLCGYGRFLRASSLDELPELVNILKGDMALVGPRPLLVKYLPRYSEEQHHRHDVRPGLTGYAQTHGRNAVTWEEKFEMDVWYTRNISFPLDFRILLDTVGTVLKHEGIHSGTSDTMEEFMGKETGDR